MHTIGVIQCRLGSTRLKRKALLKIGNFKIIEWVIRRVKKAKNLDQIVLATSNKIQDSELLKISKNLKIDCFRGSEQNVFSRFCEINKKYNAKYIVRICADNPFIDPDEIDKIVRYSKLLNKRNSYIFNHIPYKENNYIDGVGAECIGSQYFNDYEKKFKKKNYLEHVTSYIWKNKKKFIFKSLTAPKKYSFPGIKLDIDYKTDYQLFKSLLLNNKTKPELFNNKNLIKVLRHDKKF